MNKPRIFSGIQPSGNLHLGNYLGAIKNWVELQDEFDSIFCVVDLHAITVAQDPEELRQKTIEVARIYLASGIDPEKASIFIQSHVKEHTELAWILNTITKVGDLMKMTQLKDKAGFDDFSLFEKIFEEGLNEPERKQVLEALKGMTSLEAKKRADKATFRTAMEFLKKVYLHPINETGVGLFDYPVLMAADILLYNTGLVPVGEDQLQHIEIARTLAKRFNSRFGNTFLAPKPYVTKEGMRIMGLDNPAKKMSKSAASEYNYIALTDDPETVRKKIKKAVTDSGSEIVYSDEKPALKNLINIHSLLAQKTPKDIERMYAGKGYAAFKDGLAEITISFLSPLQERMKSLPDEKVLAILRQGAEKIRPLARKKLEEVKRKIGFVEN